MLMSSVHVWKWRSDLKYNCYYIWIWKKARKDLKEKFYRKLLELLFVLQVSVKFGNQT